MLDPSKACGSDVGAVLGRVWQILRRCGACLLAEPWRRPEDARLAAELRHGLVDLGPSFVRLGRRCVENAQLGDDGCQNHLPTSDFISKGCCWKRDYYINETTAVLTS